MKVKLLKKVRKRYSITSVNVIGRRIPNRVYFVLKDSKNGRDDEYSTNFNYLIRILNSWIKEDYKGTRETKIKQTKVWYNG